jgi:hypothetical protein
MLVYVFRYLTDKDKGRAARVCVEWSRIMQDKSLKAQYVRVLELTKKAKATGHDDFDTFSALKEIHEFMQVLNLGDAWEVEVCSLLHKIASVSHADVTNTSDATIQRSSSFSVGVTENFAIRLPLLNKLFELQELCMQLLVYKVCWQLNLNVVAESRLLCLCRTPNTGLIWYQLFLSSISTQRN